MDRQRDTLAAANQDPNLIRIVDKQDASLLGDWIDWYPLSFEHFSRVTRRRRADRREAARLRRQSKITALTAAQQKAKDSAIARYESRSGAVDARWRFGFVWTGGPVGGNLRYYVPALTYRGLVSDEHPILAAFAARTPKAGLGADRLMTGRTKDEASKSDSKLLALDGCYVTATAMMRGILRVDLDADFQGGFAEIEGACDAVGIPRPNIIVGHVRRRDGAVLHPHLIWILEAPVCFTAKGLPAPKALWHNVLRGLTFALAAAGADPGGLSNPLRTKNPLCPVLGRHVAAERPYSLADLARRVRLDVTDDELARGRPDNLARSPETHVDPEAGSNSVFVALRQFGRDHVAARRIAGVCVEEWRHELVSLALALGDDERQAKNRGVRVANFTWRRSEPRQRLSVEEIKRRQADSGRKSAAGQRSGSVDAIVIAYRQIVAAGGKPTQPAVQAVCGKGIATVKRCWPSVLTVVQAEGIRRSPSDKKGARAVALAAAAARTGLPSTKTLAAVTPSPAISTPAIPSPTRRPATPHGDLKQIFAGITVDARPDAPSSPDRRATVYAAWLRLRSPRYAA